MGFDESRCNDAAQCKWFLLSNSCIRASEQPMVHCSQMKMAFKEFLKKIDKCPTEVQQFKAGIHGVVTCEEGWFGKWCNTQAASTCKGNDSPVKSFLVGKHVSPAAPCAETVEKFQAGVHGTVNCHQGWSGTWCNDEVVQ